MEMSPGKFPWLTFVLKSQFKYVRDCARVPAGPTQHRRLLRERSRVVREPPREERAGKNRERPCGERATLNDAGGNHDEAILQLRRQGSVPEERSRIHTLVIWASPRRDGEDQGCKDARGEAPSHTSVSHIRPAGGRPARVETWRPQAGSGGPARSSRHSSWRYFSS